MHSENSPVFTLNHRGVYLQLHIYFIILFSLFASRINVLLIILFDVHIYTHAHIIRGIRNTKHDRIIYVAEAKLVLKTLYPYTPIYHRTQEKHTIPNGSLAD